MSCRSYQSCMKVILSVVQVHLQQSQFNLIQNSIHSIAHDYEYIHLIDPTYILYHQPIHHYQHTHHPQLKVVSLSDPDSTRLKLRVHSSTTRSPKSSSEKGFATLYDDFDFGWAASSTSVFISTRRQPAKDNTNHHSAVNEINRNNDIVQERSKVQNSTEQ